MTITIKQCTVEDIHILKEISSETFDDAYRDLNSSESMDAYLENAFHLKQLEKELTNPFSSFFFAYGTHHEPIGYLKVNSEEAQTDDIMEAALEIERIYVRREYQGQGIGKYFIKKALDIAKKQHKKRIWLGVWERNIGAIKFYQRMGFREYGTHTFHFGGEKQTDIVMVKTLC